MNQSNLPIVAIVGRPNVGKSSLFNRLTDSRQAITHAQAGTTRDANYGQVSWQNRHFLLVDTAGLARAQGHIELQAQDQIRQAAESANLIVVVTEAGVPPTHEDQAAARLALKTGKPVILALGKIDAAAHADLTPFTRLGINQTIPVSAIHGRGTGDLLDAITSQLPPASAPANHAPLTLALVGRPNVGKSSLLNALVQKQAATVSPEPGTTRDTASQTIKSHNRVIELMDTAGLRRRGRIERGVEQYSALRTLAAINHADICALVMDATDGPVAGDLHLAGQIIEAGKGLILIMNKWDAVTDKDTHTQDDLTKRLQQDFQFAWWAPLVYTSATTGLHLPQILKLALEIEQRRVQDIPTGPLNRLIEDLTTKHPPAGLKNRQPKINYATQTGSNPPAITFFASYPDFIHFSYRRYLENALRETYDLTGTPIQLDFRAKH